MQIPTIHHGGTNREALLKSYGAALSDINKAFDSLMAVEFNGRDYPNSADFFDAVHEHAERKTQLLKIRAELSVIVEHIANESDNS